jgi:5-methylcytosine-specific restriction endonuclease McrA
MRPYKPDDVAAAENRARQQVRSAKRAAKRKAAKERKKARREKRREQPSRAAHNPDWKKRKRFYSTPEWKRLRYDVLKEAKGYCCLCGASAHDGARLNVDHIKPIRDYPHLALDKSNCQVLCARCNEGKGNRDQTDWRPSVEDEERAWEREGWERFK